MRRRVAVLGATGLVGQRFVSLLANHPWFELTLLAASERGVGKAYGEVVKWVIERPMPSKVQDMTLHSIDVEMVLREGIDLVFSALPPDVATPVETELAKRGAIVVSNASPMRLEPDIPLVNPEVNVDHLYVVEAQRKKRGFKGFIVKVPNCTTAILTLSIKPILDEIGVRRVAVASMQALSGAGLYGVPSMFILDNLIPYIEGEEEKIESEAPKILGRVVSDSIEPNTEISFTASCHRVMVLEGHTIAVFAELSKEVEVEEVIKVMEEFKGNKIRGLGLPSAPQKPIVIRRENDRPQPRLDRMEGDGMSVVVGRVRRDRVMRGVKYVVLGHNTLRGAAGTGVLIAEALLALGLA